MGEERVGVIVIVACGVMAAAIGALGVWDLVERRGWWP